MPAALRRSERAVGRARQRKPVTRTVRAADRPAADRAGDVATARAPSPAGTERHEDLVQRERFGANPGVLAEPRHGRATRRAEEHESWVAFHGIRSFGRRD